MKDPANFRLVPTDWQSCPFCIHLAYNERRFSCFAYECLVLLDTICDSYERREAGDPPTISRFMRRVFPKTTSFSQLGQVFL